MRTRPQDEEEFQELLRASGSHKIRHPLWDFIRSATFILLSVALRLLVCGAVTYVAWRAVGPAGIAVCAWLFAALARPILDAITSTYSFLRALVYRDVEGRHYAYRGISLSVAEDSDGYKWLRISDVRKILPQLSRDELLRQSLGPSIQQVLPDRSVRIRAEALVTHLGRTTNVETAKFAKWIERSVVYPSQRLRQRTEQSASHGQSWQVTRSANPAEGTSSSWQEHEQR
jgi:hypothetical protein